MDVLITLSSHCLPLTLLVKYLLHFALNDSQIFSPLVITSQILRSFGSRFLVYSLLTLYPPNALAQCSAHSRGSTNVELSSIPGKTVLQIDTLVLTSNEVSTAINQLICPEGFMTQNLLNFQSIFSWRSELFHCISLSMKKNHNEIGKSRLYI